MDSQRPAHLIHGLVTDLDAPDLPVGAFRAELTVNYVGIIAIAWTWLSPEPTTEHGPTTEVELHPSDPLSRLLTRWQSVVRQAPTNHPDGATDVT